MELLDHVGKLTGKVINGWLLDITETNPGILNSIRFRNVYPPRMWVSFAGEFAGKYLTGCAALYHLTGSQDLYNCCVDFADKLISYQGENGYLSVFPKENELTRMTPCARDLYPLDATLKEPVAWTSWDAWSLYHNIIGLLSWYEITGNDRYLVSVEKIAGLFLEKFFNTGLRLSIMDMLEVNLAPYHAFALLYNLTGKQVYLDFALDIEKDIAGEDAGDYLNNALADVPFWQSPKPRWEAIHTVMGFGEMYKATGDERYLKAATQIFFSILDTDVHNTGAFSTLEMAMGTPFDNRQIETCCVVAYNAFACQLLKLTGDVRIVDFLELATYNAVLGYYSKSGKWMTYNTPMDGHRKATIQDICYKDLPGVSFINCCASNAHRGLGLLGEWYAYERSGRLYLNYYGDAKYEINGVAVEITGNYPFQNRVEIALKSSRKIGELALRIPVWSSNTVVRLDGKPADAVRAGEYLMLNCEASELRVSLEFDFSIRLTPGGGDYADKHSIYRGPLLFGFDNTENPSIRFDAIPPIPLDALKNGNVRIDGDKLTLDTGEIILNDFYSLGQGGGYYKTWLEIK